MDRFHVLALATLTVQAQAVGVGAGYVENVTVLSKPVSLSSTLTGAQADAAGISLIHDTGSPCVAVLPVTVEQSVALPLEPYNPCSATRTQYRIDEGSIVSIPPLETAQFRGYVQGDPSTIAYLAANSATVYGMIVMDETTYMIRPDESLMGPGGHIIDSTPFTTDEEGEAFPPLPPEGAYQCGTEVPACGIGLVGGCPTGSARPGRLRAELAIDVTSDVTTLFAVSSDRREVVEFVCRAIGQVSAFYAREVDLEFAVNFIQIWTTNPTVPGPSGPDYRPNNFQDYWRPNLQNIERDAVFGFWRGDSGAMWGGAVCNPDYGYGWAGVRLDLSNLVVMAQELGHGLGSRHSHCYMPRIDTCWSEPPSASPPPNARVLLE